MSSTNIYYVYAYLRDKDSKTANVGTPYYIGKGKNKRAYQQHRTGPRGVPMPLNKSNIVILETNLTQIGALAIERRMIRWYGRKDLGTGILLNLTDGGDGAPNVKITESTRLKLIAARQLRAPMSDHSKEKISKAHKGMKKFSDEQKVEMSIQRSSNKWWNNGIEQCFCPHPPDSSYVRGRLAFNNIGSVIGANKLRGSKWWNNGIVSIMAKTCPGIHWKQGRLTPRS